jgi:hypothetical protein
MTDLARIVVDDLEENFHAVKIGITLSLQKVENFS